MYLESRNAREVRSSSIYGTGVIPVTRRLIPGQAESFPQSVPGQHSVVRNRHLDIIVTRTIPNQRLTIIRRRDGDVMTSDELTRGSTTFRILYFECMIIVMV